MCFSVLSYQLCSHQIPKQKDWRQKSAMQALSWTKNVFHPTGFAFSIQWYLTMRLQNTIYLHSQWCRQIIPDWQPSEHLKFCGNWSHALSIACAVLYPLNLTESIRKNAPGKEKGGGKWASGRTKMGCVWYKSEKKTWIYLGQSLSKSIRACLSSKDPAAR